MRSVIAIPGIPSFGTPGNPVIKLPAGPRYHDFRFWCISNGALVSITTFLNFIRVWVNGVAMRDITPQHLQALAALEGETWDTGEFALWFTEPRRRGLMGDEVTSWDTFGQTEVRVELSVKAGLTAPTIYGVQSFDYKRNQSDPNDPKTAFVAALKQFHQGFNVPVGSQDCQIVMDPLRLNWVHRIILFPATAGTIQHVEVWADGSKVLEGDTLASYGFQNYQAIYRSYQEGGLGNTGGQSLYPIIFDFTNKIQDALPVAKTLSVKIWSSAAQQIDAFIETRVDSYR